MATKARFTPGQSLLLSLNRADSYEVEAKKITVASNASRFDPNRATQRWLEGMSKHAKQRFSTGLRKRREELGLTQQQLAEIAELSATAVAMIERGERAPSLDTASRLCWALDVAAGVGPEELS